MSMHKVLKLSRLHTVYTFEYASTTHNEYFLFTAVAYLGGALAPGPFQPTIIFYDGIFGCFTNFFF